MRRRDFMKGTAALFGSLAINWGGRTVTAEEDALSDAVVQEGANRGLYSQELADEFIGLTTPKGNVSLESSEEVVTESELVLKSSDSGSESEVVQRLSNTEPVADPTEAILRFDWSKYLDELVDEDLEVHCHPHVLRSGDVVIRPILPEIKLKQPSDELVFDSPSKMEQLQMDQFYVAFIIQDMHASMGMEDILNYYFYPALHSVARALNEAGKAKSGQLWVAPLAVMGSALSFGVKQHLSHGGRIPVRVSMEYDVCAQGHKVVFDFLAHYPE